MRLLKKAFLRSAYNADYRDADIVSRFDIIAVTKPLDEVEKPLNAVRWLSRRLADNGTLFLWQPLSHLGTGLFAHRSRSASPTLRPFARPQGYPWTRSQRKATSSASVPGIRLNANTRGNLLKCVSPKTIEEKAGSPPHNAPKAHKDIPLHGKSPPYEPKARKPERKKGESPAKGLDLQLSHGYTQQTECSFHLVPNGVFFNAVERCQNSHRVSDSRRRQHHLRVSRGVRTGHL